MKIIPTPLGGDDSASIYMASSTKMSVGLSQIDEVILFDRNQTVCTGIKTQKEVDELCEYLQRLKIHLP